MIACHLPYLGVESDARATALGGEVRRFTLDEFADVDPDWAHGNYFEKRCSVWTAVGSAADAEQDEEFLGRADLVRLAAACVLEAPLGSPRLSIRYYGIGQPARKRLIGPFERTLLLSNQIVAIADNGQLAQVAALADRWCAAGYRANHPVFLALEAYGGAYTPFRGRPELRVMPVMVALEAMFAPEVGPGIATRIRTALGKLIPDDPIVDAVSKLYGLRSDIMHGRQITPDDGERFQLVGALACRATFALLERLILLGTPPDRWAEALEPVP